MGIEGREMCLLPSLLGGKWLREAQLETDASDTIIFHCDL